MKNLDMEWLNACSRQPFAHYADIELSRLTVPTSQVTLYAVSMAHDPAMAERDVSRQDTPLSDLADWREEPLGRIRSGDSLVVVLENQPAITLLRDGVFHETGVFLEFALSAARTVSKAHGAGFVHGMLDPLHLTVDEMGVVRLCPPGLAALWHVTPVEPWSNVDAVVYRAPEQFGERQVRPEVSSDLYALGMMFFRHLTGGLPFTSSTPAGWRHAHLAVEPSRVRDLRADVPPVISDIVARLLRKDPQARYQSAAALILDLEQCLEEWTAHRSVTPFELGALDAPQTQIESQTLFGRQSDVAALQALITDFERDRVTSAVLVSGSGGIGKSSLIDVGLRGFTMPVTVVRGKCDQHNRTIPYAPLLQVLRSFVDQALKRDAADRARLTQELLQRLDGQGGFLVELVPTIELVIGRQPPPPPLPPAVGRERLQRALLDVIATAAALMPPLVVLLDDLQWVDEATMAVLQVMASRLPENLLLLAAFRNQEAQSLFAPQSLPDRLRQAHIRLLELELQPLTIDAVEEIAASVFDGAVNDIRSLATVIHEKTGGNPFFAKRLFQGLFRQRIVVFHPQRRSWTWDLEDLRRFPVSENVVDLLLHQMDQITPEARLLLYVMGCIGPQADRNLLCSALETHPENLAAIAEPLIQGGLLNREEDRYCFTHDRVQEAALALAGVVKQPHVHARIALGMIQTQETLSGETVFAIASHIERCGTGLTLAERGTFAEIMTVAIVSARKAALVDQALGFGLTARRLTDESWWDNHYELMLRLHLLLAEMQLATAALDDAATTISLVLERSRDATDKAVGYRLRANLLTLGSDYEGAIDAALKGLNLLDIQLKRGASRQELDQAYRDVKSALAGRAITSLHDIPPMTDLRIRRAMTLLSTMISSVFTRDGLRFLHMAKMVELTLRYGTTTESAYGLGWFGVMVVSLYDDFQDGFDYGQVALALVKRHGYEDQHTATLVAVDQVSVWTQPMSYSIACIRDAIRIGHTAGDVGMTCYARNHLVSNLLIVGEDLRTIAREATAGIELTRRLGYSDIQNLMTAQLNLVATLAGEYGEHAPRAVAWPSLEAAVVAPSSVFWVQLYKGLSRYYENELEEAVESLQIARDLIPLMMGHVDTSHCSLYLALALAATQQTWSDVSSAGKSLGALQERFFQWADVNPATFRNKALLIAAEIARLQSDAARAATLYEQSADAAEAAGFTHEAALALTLAARHAKGMGWRTAARNYAGSAEQFYRQWGALRQADRLTAEFQDVHVATAVRSLRSGMVSMDLEPVLRVSHAISEEIVLDRLIATVMENALILAGATSALLLLMNGNRPQLRAAASVRDGRISIDAADIGFPQSPMPYPVIDTVMATRKPVVLNNLLVEPSAQEHKPGDRRRARSAFCVPLLRRSELVGILYMENDQMSGMFDESRTLAIEMLAGQAAISLENAKLYENLVQENALRARSEAALRLARSEIEYKSRLTILGGIAASITHEIRQPLAAIAAQSSAAGRWLERETPDIAEAIASVRAIDRSVERTSGIIRAFRALSKDEASVSEPVVIDAVVREIAQIQQVDIERYGIALRFDLKAGDAVFLGNVTQFQQVVLNLLTNAMDAMENRPATARRIEIHSRFDGTNVTLSVRDHGSGMTHDVREKIFLPLFTTKQQGMGMGLAICKSIVEAHGGTLSVLDANPGTVFEFSVPV